MTSRTYGGRTLSPNQEFRRGEILTAAADVMRTAGVGACTVRSVAEHAGVSKGVVHYYFADVGELVELAFAQLARQYYTHIREVAAAHEPAEGLWHAVVSYVTPWDAHSSMALLWCEYYATAVRGGRLAGVAAVQREMLATFAAVLDAVAPELAAQAPALTRYVTGAVLTQQQLPVTPADLTAEVARLLAVPPPATQITGCTAQACPFHG